MSRKRAYRYEVIETWGEGTKAMAGAPNILEWQYMGDEYTWTIFDSKVGDITGTITGRYLDAGYCEDGKFATDAELATA